MSMIETVVLREPWDADRRLAELGLERAKLLKVVGIAMNAAADATSFHPANASGTLAYQHGTWALRNEFVRDAWRLDRPDGVEAISNDTTMTKVIFSNVDLACNDFQGPKPRSRKGAGAERVCGVNLFGSLPQYAPRQPAGWSIYYLMVDEKGAAELTQPVIKNNTFSLYVERIFLSYGDDFSRAPLSFDNDDAVKDFDPQVARK